MRKWKPNKTPIYAFVDHVDPVHLDTCEQAQNVADLPFIHHHVALMPDTHLGYGVPIGSVIPMNKAVVPSAVGVDIGCGMIAQQTSLESNDLPDNVDFLRGKIEHAVPHGRTNNGGPGDRGAWGRIPDGVGFTWNAALQKGWEDIVAVAPKIEKGNLVNHLGTLGGGNHFIELCLDESDKVWVMLHSGSRGVGARIGNYYINAAKEACEKWHVSLPDSNLAFLPEDTALFDEYVAAVHWAQEFARFSRVLMMQQVLRTMREKLPPFALRNEAVNCHHNYVSREHHYGRNVWITRKGAVRARLGDLGIIPGSMGAKSFIVEGKGNAESFHSCSHGAGRTMSRNAAKKLFTIGDHIHSTQGVSCKKDESVLDETPGAYKNIDDVMASQTELVDVKHTLKQFLCVKG